MKQFKLLFAVLFFLGSYAVAQPVTGLVSYFKFNNNLSNSGSGTLSATSSNTSFSTNASGSANLALMFGGTTTSYVSIVDNGNMDFSGDFSVCFGLYMTNVTINQGFLDNCLNYGGYGIWYFNADNTVRFNYRNASVGVPASLLNQWRVVCAVKNGSTMELYIDGVLLGSTTIGTQTLTYPYPPVLGQMYYNGTGGNYNPAPNGTKIDELRCYNRALSAAEVAQLVGFTLPLTMGDFSALKTPAGNKLEWETFSEQHTAYFEIERSSNGTDFTAIGKVTASGNSSTRIGYSFMDNNPAAGTNYYRLKQMDIDSRFTYSNTVVVKNNSQLVSIEIFPNPVASLLQVQLPATQKELANILITDAAGKTVYTKKLQLSEGVNASSIPVNNLPSGTYAFTLDINGVKQTKTFIKQ
ncbi:LamG-like jellyroll fold domain-containing protein [Ferruginibacter sp.]